MTMQEIKELNLGLRTYRKFQQEPISEELLRDLMDCVRIAATGMNAQELRFTVVTSPEKLAAMQELVRFAGSLPPELGQPKVGEKPVAFVIIRKTAKPTPVGDIDVGIAADRLITLAWTQGIGSTLMHAINRPKIAELLELPEDETIGLAVALGKPAVKSTICEVPEDGSLKYFLDEELNYHVPKLPFDELVEFV